MSDEFEGMFDDITVEDFFRSTTAVSETPNTEKLREVLRKRGGFGRFVDGMLHSCKTTAGLNPGAFPAFAVLVGTDRVRYFRPDDDENAEQWAARLARETVAMNAEWMFVAMCAPARMFDADEEPTPIDVNDLDAVREALATGQIQLSICWFAERHDDVRRDRRGGIISLSEKGAPLEVTEGDVIEDKNPFARVMDR